MTEAAPGGELPPAALLDGVAQFNRREFFACHETLEALWLAERRPVRALYQGILQVGVGFYHLQRGSYRGALHGWERGAEHLRAVPPVCLGVDVAGLRNAAERAARRLRDLGPRGMSRFEEYLIPTIEVHAARVAPAPPVAPGGE